MTQHSTKQVLIAARKLIEKPESWGQGDQCAALNQRCARIAISDAVDWQNPAYLEMRDAAWRAFEQFAEGRGVRFNDTHTHAEVLAAFDKAIAECAP